MDEITKREDWYCFACSKFVAEDHIQQVFDNGGKSGTCQVQAKAQDQSPDEVTLLRAQIVTLERRLDSFRFGNNYIKQFVDAKEKCAVMYPPEEVYSEQQLAFWAEEHGYVKAPGATEMQGDSR